MPTVPSIKKQALFSKPKFSLWLFIKSLFTKTKTKMEKYLLYNLDNELLVVESVDDNYLPTYSPEEENALLFESHTEAVMMLDLINAHEEFVGTRPIRK